MKTRIVLLNIWLGFGLMLTGCNELVSSVCAKGSRIDVVGFEGKRRVTNYDAETFKTSSSEFVVEKKEKGVYTVEGQVWLTTCQLNNQTVAEAQDPQTGHYNPYFLSMGSQGFDLAFAVFDKQELDKNGIPSQIVPRDTLSFESVLSPFLSTNASASKVLVINNGNVSPGKLFSLAKSASLALKIY